MLILYSLHKSRNQLNKGQQKDVENSISIYENVSIIQAPLYRKQALMHFLLLGEAVGDAQKVYSRKFPELEDDSVNYLMKFINVTTAEELRKTLYENSSYNKEYRKEKNQILDWIRRSLDHLLLVYESTDDFTVEHREQWYQNQIWLPLELLFETIIGSKSLRGESTSIASGERKNLNRVPPSTDKVQAKKMGTRVDTLVTISNVEYLCEEDKASDDATKLMEERQFKIAKEMKDILWVLFKRCSYDRTKMKAPVSLGIATLKFKAYFDVCGFKLDYVSRITRSPEFEIPSNISESRELLPVLSVVLVFGKIIMANIGIITAPPSESAVRSNLKRPHSPKQEDDFVRAVKRNVNATTPDDTTNSRFKPIFKQQNKK